MSPSSVRRSTSSGRTRWPHPTASSHARISGPSDGAASTRRSRLPGVHTTYDREYSYVGTRGFGLPGDFNTRLLFTINGNRLNDDVYDFVLSGQAFPLDLEAVERIEHLPGPAARSMARTRSLVW